MRLNRYLAFCGLGSRRSCDSFIRGGLVEVNGDVCFDFSVRVELGRDLVRYRGKLLKAPLVYSYIMLHKPVGYLCTRRDSRYRRTIYSLLGSSFRSLFHVGRLDYNSSGLLLLTNDGELSHRLLHPSYGVFKEYFVKVDGFLSVGDLDILRGGVEFEEGVARASGIRLVKVGVEGSSLYISISQGMRRQIRRMFEFIGRRVVFLRRDSFGPLRLFPLRSGFYRELREDELVALLSIR